MSSRANHPIVTDHPDGYRVEWPGYQRAFALFSVKGPEVIITDIFRDGEQPKGSAGEMLAAAFLAKGISHPLRVRMANILPNQPTLAQLEQGMRPEETVLGRVLVKLGAALRLAAVSWQHGQFRGKPFLEVQFGN